MDASNLPRSAPTVVSRRTFLAYVAGVAVGLPLIAACAPTAPSASPTSAPAPAGAAPTSKPAAASAPAPAITGGGAASTPAPAAQQRPQSQPKSGGTLRAATVGEFVNIDGHYYSPKAGLAMWMIYDTLTRYDDDLKVQPMLAESWEQCSVDRQFSL